MPDRDFFSFCTSLKPLELKALGELSYIRHVDGGVVLFSQGQPGDLLYIINRGRVELLGGPNNPGVPSTFSRGDVVGDLEVLTATPRTRMARAAEPSSMRCFHFEDFPELVRRAPSFFRFLSEHLAARLQGAADAEPVAPREERPLELGGNLANFDLVTIYQTIANSAQTGELRIINEDSDVIAAFAFDAGQPRSGQFEHLTGEEALLQLFLRDSLSGAFLFNSRGHRVSDCVQSAQINRHAGDMLISAIQGRDELQHAKERMPFADATLHRRKLNFEWPKEAPVNLRPAAEQIWQFAYSTPTALGTLYNRCAVCELKIYEIVEAFVASGHFELRNPASENEAREKVA